MTAQTQAELFADGWQLGAPEGEPLAMFRGFDWAAYWPDWNDEPMPMPEWSQDEAGIRAVFADGSALLLGHFFSHDEGEWVADGMFTFLTDDEWRKVLQLESFFHVVWAESSPASFSDLRQIGAGGAVGVGTVGECDGCRDFVPFGFVIAGQGVNCVACALNLV